MSFTDLTSYPEILFLKNEYIIRQGDFVEYVYFLAEGTCRRSTFTNKGDEIIYDILSANNSSGCFLGGLTIYYPEPIHPTNFIASTKCRCFRLTTNEFKTYLSTHPDLLHTLLYHVMERYSFLDKVFLSKQKKSSGNQVCNLIVNNLEKKNGANYLKKHLTNSEISRHLGMHRVTVSQIMSRLILENIIEKTSSGILIKDLDALLIYAQDEDTLKYTRKYKNDYRIT